MPLDDVPSGDQEDDNTRMLEGASSNGIYSARIAFTSSLICCLCLLRQYTNAAPKTRPEQNNARSITPHQGTPETSDASFLFITQSDSSDSISVTVLTT